MSMNIKRTVSFAVGVCVCSFLIFPILVDAAPTEPTTPKKDAAGCETSSGGKVTCKLDNPLQKDPKEVTTIIGNALNGAIGLVGAITLVMFVYGGFNWLISGGSPERIKTGRDTMIWAAIGLVAVFAAYGTLNFVFKNLFSGT